MPLKDNQPIVPAYLEPYRDALAHHGPTFEATLWKSRHAQRARFRALVRMIDLRGRTVVDAGCGLGDFAAYLAEQRIAIGRYIGVDAFPDLMDRARARSLAGAEFRVADFARNTAAFSALIGEVGADVVVFSGSLNTFEQPAAIEVLGPAFDAARIGIAFNFLSAASPVPRIDPDDPARRFNPAAMLAWALGKTPLVRLRSDYLRGHDATIAMRHAGDKGAPIM